MKNRSEPTDTPIVGKVSPSAMLESMSGSLGDRVVARTRSGLAARSKPKYRYPKNAAVQAGNARLKAANEAWNAMTVQQAEAWNRYAEGLTHHNDLTGEAYHPTGKNVLVALTTKFLQANPGAMVPLDPPTGTYIAPSATLTVTAGTASLVFTASGPTPPGTVVELLVQPLLNGKRSPANFYKSAAFVTFDAAHLTATLPVLAGWYATAYRFVEKATGRSTMLMPLGKTGTIAE